MTDRPIKQTFKPLKSILWIAFVGIILAVAVGSYFSSPNHSFNIGRFVTVLPILLVATACIMAPIIFVMSSWGPKWYVTDEGLKRVQGSKAPEIISWEQIYHMENKANGFFVHWRAVAPPGEHVPPDQLDQRAQFFPLKTDGDEIIALWRQKTSHESQTEGRTHFRTMVSRDSRKTRHLCWGLMAAGFMLIAVGTIQAIREYPSTKWPSAGGKLVSHHYRQLPYDQKHREQDAQLDMTYDYEVDGRSYHSDSYSLWSKIYQDSDEVIQKYAQEHPDGTPVIVYFNPKNPAEAILVPGPNWSNLGAFGVFGFFLAFIGFMIQSIVALTDRKRKASRD